MKINQPEISYKMVGKGIVEIIDNRFPSSKNFRCNLETAITGLENVKKNKSTYRTEEAYIRDFNKFLGAINFLNNQCDINQEQTQ